MLCDLISLCRYNTNFLNVQHHGCGDAMLETALPLLSHCCPTFLGWDPEVLANLFF